MDDYNQLASDGDLVESFLKLKQEELRVISEKCNEASQISSLTFDPPITWVDAFFCILLGDSSGLQSEIISSFQNLHIFDCIKPAWDVNLSLSCYKWICQYKEEFNSMYFIIDLMKGRLKIEIQGENYFIINSYLSPSEHLFGLIVAESYPKLALKIIVCCHQNSILELDVNNTIEEFCSFGRKLEKMENLIFESDLIKVDGWYVPGVIIGVRNDVRYPTFDLRGSKEDCIKNSEPSTGVKHKPIGSIKCVNSSKTNEIKSEELSVKVEACEIDQYVNCDAIEEKQELNQSSIINKEEEQKEISIVSSDHYMDADIIQDPENIEGIAKEELDECPYIDRNLPFTPSAEFQDKINEIISSFKFSTLKNKEKYLKSVNLDKDTKMSWEHMMIDWHTRDLINSNEKFNIYAQSNLVWHISFNIPLLKKFENLNEDEFKHYFYFILLIGKGFLVSDAESFEALNKDEKENLIFIKIEIKNTNLKPLLAVLCIDENNESILTYQVKLYDFCSESNIEKKIQDFRKECPIVDINMKLGRKGLRSMVIIEKNNKILPCVYLNESVVDFPKKSIFLLYKVIDGQNEFTMKIYDQYKNILGLSQRIDLGENGNASLFKFEIEKPFETKFRISMNYNDRDDIHPYEDIKKDFRELKNQRSHYLFNVIFCKHVKDFTNRTVPGQSLLDPYEQLYYFLNILVLANDESSLEFVIESFNKSIDSVQLIFDKYYNSQAGVLEFINNYLASISTEDYEKLYFSMATLSVIENFPFTINMQTDNLLKVAEIIKNSQGKFLLAFRSKANMEFALIGLTKLLFALRNQNHDANSLFIYFIDYTYLAFTLKLYLEYCISQKIKFEDNEIDYFLELSSLLSNYDKEEIIEMILCLVKGPFKLIHILSSPYLHWKTLDKRRMIVKQSIQSSLITLDDLHSELSKLKNENIENSLLSEEEISNLISQILTQSNFLKEDFPKLRALFKIIHTNFQNLSIDIKSIIINLLNSYLFSECYVLMSLVPDLIPELFQIWICNSFTSISNIDELLRIEQELQTIPSKLHESLSAIVYTNFDSSVLSVSKDLFQSFDKLRSLQMRSAFKSLFKDKLFTPSQFDKTISDLFKKRFMRELDNCYLYKEIVCEAELMIRPSEEDLIERILKSPQENDILFIFLEEKERFQDSDMFKIISNFITKFGEELVSKSISFNKFSLVQNHSANQRKNFFEYVRYSFDNKNLFENFMEQFFKIEKLHTLIRNIIGVMKKIMIVFVNQFSELRPIVHDFEDLERNYRKMKLSELEKNDVLKKLDTFLNREMIPYNSKIFQGILRTFTQNKKQNFMSHLKTCSIKFEELTEEIINFEEKKLNIEKIYDWIKYLNEENVRKEIRFFILALSKINKNTEILEAELRKASIIIKNYFKMRPLMISYSDSVNELNFTTNPFIHMYKIESKPYNSENIKILSTFEGGELSKLSNYEIDQLEVFFKIAIQFQSLIYLATSVEEDDLSYWRESFVNSIDDKGLSIDILENFISIASFYSKLKSFTADFNKYRKKLNEYLCLFPSIYEDMARCNQSITLLEDYNRSLNNQEQIKLNKIKMICSDSKLDFIYGVNGFSVELYVRKIEQRYSTISIQLNELKELRDRARLSKYIINQKTEMENDHRNEDLIVYDNFVDFVDCVCSLVEILNLLRQTLYKDSLVGTRNYLISQGIYKDVRIDLEFYSSVWNALYLIISVSFPHFHLRKKTKNL